MDCVWLLRNGADGNEKKEQGGRERGGEVERTSKEESQRTGGGDPSPNNDPKHAAL